MQIVQENQIKLANRYFDRAINYYIYSSRTNRNTTVPAQLPKVLVTTFYNWKKTHLVHHGMWRR